MAQLQNRSLSSFGFQPVVRRARFVYSPYTAQEMQGFAQVLADEIKGRIQRAQNVYDQPASSLKPGRPGRRGYPDFKSARGIDPVRNWMWTGHTLSCLQVLGVNENRAAIGFLSDTHPGRSITASQNAAIQNSRERQWGVSPRDRMIVFELMHNYRPLVTCNGSQSLPV